MFDWLKKSRDYMGSKLVYGIMNKCERCVYQKRNEPILIVSRTRGPRIIMFKEMVFVRHGDCLGYKQCGECLECYSNKNTKFPCRWILI